MSSKTLAELADEVWTWQQATFGDAMTVHGAVAKVRDEVAETLDAYSRFTCPNVPRAEVWAELLEELADVFFMLVQLGGLKGFGAHGAELVHPERWPLPYYIGRMTALVQEAEAPAAEWPVMMMAFGEWALACASISAGDRIIAAIEAKLAKNKARTWAKPAADGTISHVKGVE